jgi:protease-4
MMQKNSGCLWMLAGFGLCLGFLFVLGIVFSASMGSMDTVVKASAPKFDEAIVADAKPYKDAAGKEVKESDAKIAVIYLRGIITSAEPGAIGPSMVDDLKLQLEQAATDEKVKAVVLYVDSPGGEVTASDNIYNAVRKVRDGGYGTKKPVVVYMGSLAASGGYYVACGGSWLMANETTLTGSIGVIMQSFKYRELLGKVGVDVLTFKSGQFKDMMSGSREMTQEEKDYVQKMIMDTYGKFVGIVARERKQKEDDLRHGMADGRIISGKDAREAKLIDANGEVEDAYAKAMELGKVKSASIIRYESPFKLGKLLRFLGQSEKTSVEVNVTKALLPKLEAGRMYFLPSFYAP